MFENNSWSHSFHHTFLSLPQTLHPLNRNTYSYTHVREYVYVSENTYFAVTRTRKARHTRPTLPHAVWQLKEIAKRPRLSFWGCGMTTRKRNAWMKVSHTTYTVTPLNVYYTYTSIHIYLYIYTYSNYMYDLRCHIPSVKRWVEGNGCG